MKYVKKIYTKCKEKRVLLYLISFLLPILIAIIGFYVCLHFKLTGNLIPTYGDFQAQYTNLFTYLQNALKGDASFIYSFSKGLGGNMASTLAYYLLCPLNLLVAFTSPNNIPFMILAIIILKMGLSGLCMFIFLNYSFKIKDMKLIIFSTCYALSAYVVNFYFCVMWLDAVYMAPLIFLGIKRLVEGKSSFMYIICLTFSISMNYYTGYMLCIFSCIYFLFEIIMQEKYRNKKSLLQIVVRFLVSSLLSGLMSMIVLIPMICDLNGTARALGNYQGGATLSTIDNVYNYWQLVYRTLIGSYNADEVLKYESINLYFGLICLPLIYFYFINKDIQKKEKIFSLGMIILFLLSYSIKYINYIWHGFAFPNGLNYRFMFLFIFYFIYMACNSFLHIQNIKIKHYYIFMLVYMLLINGMCLYSSYVDDLIPLYISIGVLLLYLFILKYLGDFKNNLKNKKELLILTILLVAGELSFNIYYSLNSYFSITAQEYSDYIDIYGSNINKYKSDNNDFYRINQSDYFTSTAGLLFDYNGVESFLSTNNVASLNFLRVNGYFANEISSIVSSDEHILIDSILGIKYYITKDECGVGYKKVDTFKYSSLSGYLYNITQVDVNICENEHALPVGYMIDDEWNMYGSDIENISYLEVSKSIVNSMLQEPKEYYTYIEADEQNDNQYTFMMPEDGSRVYVSLVFSDHPDIINIYVNDIWKVNSQEYHRAIFALDNENPGETVTIRIESIYDDELNSDHDLGLVQFYKENIEEIYSGLDELNEYAFDVDCVTDTSIRGKVTATEEKNTLFFSIPYENGWNVYVDGNKAEIETLYDAFIGIELSPGEHEIELKYSVPGLKLGTCVSGISFLFTTIYLYVERKKQKESQIMLEK